MQRKVALCILAILVYTGVSAAQPLIDPSAMNEHWERKLIHKNTPGKLVEVASSIQTALAISVHGIDSAPVDILPLIERRIHENNETYTYAWDIHFRRLNDSANDFAVEFTNLLKLYPRIPVVIDAHSMGGRMTLVALGRLVNSQVLLGRDIQLNLIAPPLSGYDIANSARYSPEIIQSLIRNVRPGIDMGTKCPFQYELEAVRLPANVKIRTFAAENDRTAPLNAKDIVIAKKINSSLQVIEGVDHDSIMEAPWDSDSPYCGGG